VVSIDRRHCPVAESTHRAVLPSLEVRSPRFLPVASTTYFLRRVVVVEVGLAGGMVVGWRLHRSVTVDSDSVWLLHSTEMVRRSLPDFLLVQAKISFKGAEDLVTDRVIMEPNSRPMTTKAIGLNFMLSPPCSKNFENYIHLSEQIKGIHVTSRRHCFRSSNS
jgi:hypothetical protein